MTDHKIVSREEWQAARDELLKREKQHTQMGDELARQRRELPWVTVEKDYRFDADDGPRTLAGLFDGRSQLLIYHFMFGPAYQAGDPVNSSIADALDGLLPHLHARDLTLLLVSQAPLDNLQAYKQRMGWSIPWVSAANTDFNFDFGASHTRAHHAAGLQPPARRPLRDRRLQWRSVSPPGLVLQPQGQPQDHSRGGYPDVNGTGGGTGRHRPRRTVAEAGRGVSCRRRIPDQDHATDSGVHADPPGLTCAGNAPDPPRFASPGTSIHAAAR
jgi:hypothetical protein